MTTDARMNGMTKVWLVGAGEYSDWRVAALFSTKEAADRYVEIKNETRGDYASGPDAYDVIDACPDPKEHLNVHIRIGKETRREPTERISTLVPGIDAEPFDVDQRVFAIIPSEWEIMIDVSGFDFDRVRKVASERAAHALANFDLMVEQEKARRAEPRS